jgi:VWFA-related protein
MRPWLLVCAALSLTAATSPRATATAVGDQAAEMQPRFRGGANLVRVDTYVTAGGKPVTDLTIDDFEVLEDGVPQRLESFQLVQPRAPAPQALLREPNTVGDSRTMARDPEARLFVLFMDIWHVQLEGSHRAQEPLTRLLDRAIGQDDLVGVMHPDMAARSLAFARRTQSIAGILENNWFWGERDRVATSDPREQELEQCYPDHEDTMGIAHEMIRRRRESKTLKALDDLIRHLEQVREERKFVLLLTEGWLLRGVDQTLARTLKLDPWRNSGPPPPQQIGVDPGGRLRMDPRDQGGNWGSCERERAMLAHTDHRAEFDVLIQRANRANVSFYPIDFRGLVTFDEPINSTRKLTMIGPDAAPSADAARLTNTDGHAILNSTAFDRDLKRIVEDTGAYYLLGYYSTNTKLDGRYRRLTVRVKPIGLDVRARPGYLAPTEADLSASNAATSGSTSALASSLERAFAALGAARGSLPLRAQTVAAPQQIWLTGELDPAVAKAPEWQQGGRARATFTHESGTAAELTSEVELRPGQRAFQLRAAPAAPLAPGRYIVRLEVAPAAGGLPFQISIDAPVPAGDWLLSSHALTARRGPATGLNYVATADARFRRTERIRLEVPRSRLDAETAARLVGRDGQPLTVPMVVSERTDDTDGRLLVVDVTLAPLAPGEYAVDITAMQENRQENASYAFRIVP